MRKVPFHDCLIMLIHITEQNYAMKSCRDMGSHNTKLCDKIVHNKALLHSTPKIVVSKDLFQHC